MGEILSLNALAKALGRDKAGLSRHAKNGTIPKRSDGKFDLEKVSAALKLNVDLSKARMPPGQRKAVDQSSTPRRRSTPSALIDHRSPVAGHDVETILVDGRFMTVANAQALAETYRARLAKFQFDAASGAAREAEALRWKAWVPRAADMLAEQLGVERNKLTASLEDLVLRELGSTAL
jgi:hypothetical protein